MHERHLSDRGSPIFIQGSISTSENPATKRNPFKPRSLFKQGKYCGQANTTSPHSVQSFHSWTSHFHIHQLLLCPSDQAETRASKPPAPSAVASGPACRSGTMPFTFISVGSDGLPQSAERSLVRSHCMRGRNKREDSRRSRQARRREARRFQSPAACAQDLAPEPGVAAHTEESVATSALVECAHVLSLTVFSPDLMLAELAGSPGRGDRELLYKCIFPRAV